LPVENVFLKNVHADLIKGNLSIHENLLNFESQN